MSHEKKISTACPLLIVLILDDSGSMLEVLAGTTDAKYKWVERYVGVILDQLLNLSTEVHGNGLVIKPRYYLHVISYGSAIQRWGDPQMDIEAAVKRFTDTGNSLGLGGKLGGTDARTAFEEAHNFLSQQLAGEKYRNSFPPMVFHLTDGQSWTDASAVAEQIKQLATSDGNALICNAFIGTETSLNYTGPEDFTGYVDVSEVGPDEDNIRLFNMSSEAPESIAANLKADGIFPKFRPGSRLFYDVRSRDM